MFLCKHSRAYLEKCFASALYDLSNATKRSVSVFRTSHSAGMQTNNTCLSTNGTHIYNNFNGKYSLEQQQHLLNVINNSDVTDLLNYGLSERRSKKLLQWRDDNGGLQYLHDILRIGGFGVKVANKLLQNVLEPNRVRKANNRQTAQSPIRGQQFVTPNFHDNYCTYINSILAVRIGVNIITWSRIVFEDLLAEDASNTLSQSICKLSHWHYEIINEKRLHLSDLVHRCQDISQQIPKADCYVLESPQTIQASINPGSIEQQNVNLQKAQMYAIIGYALSSRKNYQLNDLNVDGDGSKAVTDGAAKDFSFDRNVFYVKRFLTARLFNHLVGGEKISSEQTVLDMMHNTVNNTSGSRSTRTQDLNNTGSAQKPTNVQFPIELTHLFKRATRSEREFLGQALLLNLAFIHLVLLKDAESIKSVTRYVKKSSSG